MNRKAAIYFLTVMTAIVVSVAILFGSVILSGNSLAWVQEQKHLTGSSNEIYSINQGFANNVADFAMDSEEEFEAAVSQIFSSSSSAHYETVIPGDEVYYSFYARIRSADIGAGTLSYQVDLNISGETKEGAPAGTGDYLSFLHNCMIEANRSRFIVLSKTGSSFSHIRYYMDASAGGVLKQKDDSYNENEDTLFSYFDYNSGTSPSFTNTEVSSFCSDGTNASIGASLIITIPDLSGLTLPVVQEDGDEYVYIMLFVPIWYVDTEENQNHEMNSVLKIDGCTIVALSGG